MRAERRARSCFVAALATLFVLLAAPAAQAGPNGGVGYRVDGEPGSTIDGGFITLKVSAGGTANGHFYATNSGDRDAQLSVYAADGLTGDTTGIVYSGAGEARRDAGSWLSPSTRGMLLRADDSRRVDFSLHVPAGATPGDHVGGIVLEQRRTGGTINQVVRNVVPVLVDVAGSAGYALELRSALVTDLPGTDLPAVTVKMRNDGRRICRPMLSVALTGPGERGAPVARALDAILPGDAVPFPLPWPRALDSGNYTALVTATGCGPTRTMRTDVRSDVTAETGGGPKQSSDNELVTTASPTRPEYTAPPSRSGAPRAPAAATTKRPRAPTPRAPPLRAAAGHRPARPAQPPPPARAALGWASRRSRAEQARRRRDQVPPAAAGATDRAALAARPDAAVPLRAGDLRPQGSEARARAGAPRPPTSSSSRSTRSTSPVHRPAPAARTSR